MIPSKQQPPKKTRKRWAQTPIYQPSIYSYTCRGAFSAKSEDRGSEGTCRGLRSRLELLSDMDVNTREEAIKSFTYMTDYELEEDDANSLNQKTKSILVSPALIYKDDAAKSTKSELPEEELIKRQEWSCYGSTEVEVLVLKNEASGAEHVAAISPRNVGVSVRKIEADEGSITSIGVGWLNIVVDAGPSFVQEEEDTQQQEPQRDKQQQQSSPQQPQTSLPEQVPQRPTGSPGTMSRGRESLTRFLDFSARVGTQMRQNVYWLYTNMQDDFLSRSYSAGQKITANLPKTLDRTVSYVNKVIEKWQGDDDDDGKE